MTEYGVFNDEGCIASQYYSEDSALEALESEFSEEPWGYVSAICEDHEEQPKYECEECLAELEEDDEA